MPCEPFPLAGGVAIICSRGRRRKTCATPGCNRTATKLCDFPLEGKRAGKTCDRDMCDACAVSMGEVIRLSSDPRWTTHRLRMASSEDTVDFCQAHAKHAQEPAQPPPAPPVAPPSRPASAEQFSLDFIPPTKGPRT